MERTRSIEEFVRDPVGRYNVGATHLVWCYSPTLCGSSHWGRPSEEHARELVTRLEFTRHPALAGGFFGYMDTRGMEAFSWPTFGVVSDYARSQISDWTRLIRRHAIVVPPGVVGVVVAGLLPLLGPNYPLRFFQSVESAWQWLGQGELGEVLDEVEALVAEARGVPPLVRALREYLDGDLVHASVESAARQLHLSPRSLQRELKGSRTRFSAELIRARLRAARTMLSGSDEKVESIARRVGFASSSQLSAIFRRELGETPSRYRERRRGAVPE